MKYLLLILLILTIVLVISQAYVLKSTSDSETANYETLAYFDNFEIRKYPELTVATTKLNEGSYSKNSRIGFGRLAAYIFGGNTDKSQIAMTSPVQMNIDFDTTMSFFMPENIAYDDLPKPNNGAVSIQMIPSKIVAVIGFKGWASDEILKRKFNELKSLLSDEGINFYNKYSFLGYNPPYQLINRKNEVLINLKNYKN